MLLGEGSIEDHVEVDSTPLTFLQIMVDDFALLIILWVPRHMAIRPHTFNEAEGVEHVLSHLVHASFARCVINLVMQPLTAITDLMIPFRMTPHLTCKLT